MQRNYMKQAEEYYTNVGKKNLDKVAAMLHPDVQFFGPLASLQGKEAVLQATGHFMAAIQSLTIRAVFANQDEAVVIYEVDMPGVSQEFPGVSWLRFDNEQIVRIQLFYDGSRLQTKKAEIFS